MVIYGRCNSPSEGKQLCVEHILHWPPWIFKEEANVVSVCEKIYLLLRVSGRVCRKNGPEVSSFLKREAFSKAHGGGSSGGPPHFNSEKQFHGKWMPRLLLLSDDRRLIKSRCGNQGNVTCLWWLGKCLWRRQCSVSVSASGKLSSM